MTALPMPPPPEVLRTYVAGGHAGHYRLVAVAKTDAPVLAALSSLWRKIREKDSRAPDVVIDLQPGRPSSCGTVEWDTAPVLVMNLKQGDEKLTGAQILEWMLHMAAHAASFGDTGAEGRYHSQAFAEAARGLGLSVSSTRIPGIGWSPQGLARGTRTRYATEVRAIDRVMRHWTPDVLRAGYRGPQKMVCACEPPRTLRMNKGVAALGPVTCSICGQKFWTAPSQPKSAHPSALLHLASVVTGCHLASRRKPARSRARLSSTS